MKITGFTIIRNAIKYDYPVIESISSILPICDNFVVLVGKSEDETLNLIKSIKSEKINIYESIWDENLRVGGKVLADETNKAMKFIPTDTDWSFYIQADEVIHEKYHTSLRNAMKENLNNSKIDGLLLKYIHFYGSYDYIGESNRWYRNEIRIIRNNSNIYSYGDAQGFRKNNNEKLKVKQVDAYVNHYGWVKEPKAQQEKARNFNKLWHDDEWIESNIKNANEFDYSEVDALKKYEESHPQVMQNRIKSMNWKFDFDLSKNNFKTKEKIQRIFEKYLGYRIGEYKNYKLIK